MPTLRRSPIAAGVRNLSAGAAIAAVVVQLAVAQVTLALTAAFVTTAALSRWRPAWLLGPAVLGLGWVSVIGVGRAWAGFLGWAGYLVTSLNAPSPRGDHVGGLAAVATQWHRWLPGQIPVALIAAAAEAGFIGCLAKRRRYRPGLLVAARRCYVRVSLRRGEVATADGACLGVVRESGRRVAVSWLEAAGGVLVAGHDAAEVTRTGLDLAVAAILHRKTVLIVDLTDGQINNALGGRRGGTLAKTSVLRSVAAASAEVHAPLAVFGAGACYEPLSGADPADAASLLLSMTDSTEEGHVLAGQRADPIDIGMALVRRQVVLFPIDLHRHGAAGLTIARLVLADLSRALADRAGVQADCLLWINGCDPLDRARIAAAIGCGSKAGVPTVVSTTAGAAAADLVGQVNVVVVRGRPPRNLTGLAGSLPVALPEPDSADALSVRVRGPVARIVPDCRVVR